MTHTQDTKNQDRGIWEQYRRGWPEQLRTASAIEPDGEDANQIAAFLDDRLSGRERRAIEKRLAHEPAFREAFLAARELATSLPDSASDTSVATAPAELVAWAKNLKPMTPERRATDPRPKRGRRTIGFAPALGFAFGMACLGIVAGYAVFRMIEPGSESPRMVDTKDPKKPDVRRADTKDPADKDNNSIFSSNPDFVFDGLDIDPE